MSLAMPKHPLSLTLTLDAITSGASGLLLLVAGGPIATLLSPASELFGFALPTVCRAVGLFLLVFAGLALAAARAAPARTGLVWEVLVLNIAWVLGSVLLVELAWDGLTLLGRLAIIAVALVVAVFALLQGVGLKRAQA
jgi:hypothetical protein